MVQQLIAPNPSRDRLAGGEERLSMSYEEYLAWEETEGNRGEWVDGEVIVFEMPSLEHHDLADWLTALLRICVLRLGLGRVISAPFEMRIEAVRSARQPDLLFVSTEHLGRFTSRRLEGPADLAIEIVSEHSGRRDRREKLHEYASAGVPEYWVIDPRPLRRELLVYHLHPEGDYVGASIDPDGTIPSNVLPRLRIPVAWLWQTPLPDLLDAIQALLGDVERLD